MLRTAIRSIVTVLLASCLVTAPLAFADADTRQQPAGAGCCTTV